MKESFPEFANPQLMHSPESVTPGVSGFDRSSRQTEEMSLGIILASLRKYWYVSILTGGLMMAGITYKTLTEPEIYKSEIQISIELKSSSSVASALAAASGSNGGAGLTDERSMTMETIIQLLRSKTRVKQAIDKIPDLKLRQSIGVKQILEHLTIEPGKNTNILKVSYKDTSPSRIVAILNSLSEVYIDYSIAEKKVRTKNSIEFINKKLPETKQKLENSAKQIEQFRSKYKFVDPVSSAQALAAYRQEITAKLNEARGNYEQTKEQYQQLKIQLTAVGLQSNNNLSTSMLTQDVAYQELFKELNIIELKYIQEKVRFNEESPIVIDLKEKMDGVLSLMKVRAQQVLKREVTDSELTSGGINNFGNSLAQNLANKQAELETSLVAQTALFQNLEEVYKQVQADIAQLPELQKQYTELDREYTISSQELTAFLQKLQEFKIADAEEPIPWKLVDPPEFPKLPISPDVPRSLGLGLVGSLLVGVLSAVGLNKLDGRIDNPDTVKVLTGMPILALIPKVEDLHQSSSVRDSTFAESNKNKIDKNKSKSKNYAYWSFVEAIRTLALGIALTSVRDKNQPGKIIALTSSLPKEGKSTITFHTSNTLAQLGYRVLLIDADLHKSSISQLCATSPFFNREECDSSDGLSDAILGTHNWKDLIKTSPDSKLDVLFCGKQSVSSVILFSSPRFADLMKEWKKVYEFVILDTPPIVGLSDTRLIASMVDGLVYVVSLNVAQKQVIDRGIDIVSSINTPVLGLAINRVDNHYSGYHKYYQYYQASHNLQEQSNSKALDPERNGIEV